MIRFFAAGKPVAKARHRTGTSKKTGKSYRYTPKNTVRYETYLADLAKMEMSGKNPTKAPIKLDLVLLFEIPKSWPSWKREAAETRFIEHTTKPDADNVVKAIKDALNKVVWHDDAQVCQVSVTKVYSDTPGVQIEVTELTTSPAQITKQGQLAA